MSHDFPLGLSTAVYRVFRGATGAVGLLARFQYETDAEKWCELLPYDPDYLHVLVPRDDAPKVYGLVEVTAADPATERDSLERIQDEMDNEVSQQFRK